VALTTHPHLAMRLKKEQSYTSTPFWALMACSMVNFTFIFTVYMKTQHSQGLQVHNLHVSQDIWFNTPQHTQSI
jgi:hypothetical protein